MTDTSFTTETLFFFFLVPFVQQIIGEAVQHQDCARQCAVMDRIARRWCLYK